jgi:hypothetical protein
VRVQGFSVFSQWYTSKESRPACGRPSAWILCVFRTCFRLSHSPTDHAKMRVFPSPAGGPDRSQASGQIRSEHYYSEETRPAGGRPFVGSHCALGERPRLLQNQGQFCVHGARAAVLDECDLHAVYQVRPRYSRPSVVFFSCFSKPGATLHASWRGFFHDKCSLHGIWQVRKNSSFQLSFLLPPSLSRLLKISTLTAALYCYTRFWAGAASGQLSL